jgi:acyl-CoA thioester hydrolase
MSSVKPRPLLVELQLLVKTYDVDFAGIVHNAVYIRWLEDLRLQLLDRYYPLGKLLAKGQGPVLSRTEILYRQPLRLLDEPVGRMWVSGLGRARWHLEAEYRLGQSLIAEARQDGYFVDLASTRVIPIPDELRQAWSAASGSP